MWNLNEHKSTNIHPGKTEKGIWDNDIHTAQDRSKILCQLFIFMELDPFYYHFVITKTMNLSQAKLKILQLDQYSPINRYQMLYGTTTFILLKMGKHIEGNYSYLWRFCHFPTNLWLPRHWIWVLRNRNFCSWTNIHPEKHQKFYWTTISIPQNTGEKYRVNYSYLWSYSHFTTILW